MATNNWNKKKSDQLGMQHGTAQNILRKSILFELAKRLGLDACYRCNEKIMAIEEFTIEHKVNWLDTDNPKEMFFDLENIAFSHKLCNYGNHARHTVNVNNSSGYRGVSKSSAKRHQKKPYTAQCKAGKKSMYLGNFATAVEAAEVYDKKVVELYGDDCLTNKKLGLLL